MKQPDHEAVTRPNSKEFMKALRGNRDFLSNPVTIALSAVTLFLISQLIGGLLALPIIKSVSDTNIQLLTVVLFSAITLCVIILLLKKLLRFKLSSIGIARPKLKFMFQAVPAFALYFIVSAGFTALAIRFIPSFNAEQVQDVAFAKNTAFWPLVAAFFSLVIITPIFEETIFRGLLYKRLRTRLSFKASILIASVVFAVAHMQWNVSVDTFALSLVLCWLVEKSGSIAPAIFLHTLKNSVAFLLLFIIK